MNKEASILWFRIPPGVLVLFLAALFVNPIDLSADSGLEIDLLLVSKTKVVALSHGKRKVFRIGEKTLDGLTLIATDSDTATFEKNGRVYQLRLSRFIGNGPKETQEISHPVFSNANGMLFTKGSINGYPVNFLIDTGAQKVALSSKEAERIGIDYRMDGEPSVAVTASGLSQSYDINLRSVKVGRIELLNVKASIVKGDFPLFVLLGMSFLERVNIQHTTKGVILKKK